MRKGIFYMKTKEELDALKKETGTLNQRPHVLTEKELEQSSGGATYESATGTYKISCSTPGCMFNLDIQPTCWDPTNLACPLCGTGTLSYTFTPYDE